MKARELPTRTEAAYNKLMERVASWKRSIELELRSRGLDPGEVYKTSFTIEVGDAEAIANIMRDRLEKEGWEEVDCFTSDVFGQNSKEKYLLTGLQKAFGVKEMFIETKRLHVSFRRPK